MSEKFIFNFLMNSFIEEACSANENNLLKNYIARRRKTIKKRTVLFKTITRKKRKIPKCEGYFRTIEKYPDDIFKSHFRMTRSTFMDLENVLQPLWKKSFTGRPPYSLKKALYITLWKLSNKNSFREICDRFHVGKGTSYTIFSKVVKLIAALASKFVKWPMANTEQLKIIEGFQNCRPNPFPYVLGCLDSTHIKIPAPHRDAISYYSRKGDYSLILQGVCDSKYRFLDVFIGYPGSCHDATVWKSSPLGKFLESGQISLPSNAHLLADSAYALATYIMVPYRDNGFLTPEQKTFNFFLSSTRVCIEQSFGILKRKFQILEYLNIRNLHLAKYVILSCIVLHNFIISKEGLSHDDIAEQATTSMTTNLSDGPSVADIQTEISEGAKQKRDNLTMLFSA